jgi:pimeloyl-ACP methyl ester carboxylesterase
MDLSERFEWQGRQIAWGRTGSGPATVLCHGTPWSSRLWVPFADALARDFTVYLWDMPGYGRSSKRAEHAVDFGVQAEAFAALLEHCDLDRPHLIAHDFGGAVSLRAHLVLGVPYASLMLINVVAIPPSGSPFFRFVHDYPDLLGQLPAYIHTAIVRTYIEGASHRGLRDEDLDALVEPWTGEDGQPAFYRQIADYDERFLEENEQRLGQIDIPVRVLWGTQDAWIPAERAQKLTSLIPGATLRLIDDAGHLMHYDAPIPLADELRVWLTDNARSPAEASR